MEYNKYKLTQLHEFALLSNNQTQDFPLLQLNSKFVYFHCNQKYCILRYFKVFKLFYLFNSLS